MATNQTFYIKFFAPVIQGTIAALIQIVDNKLKQGASLEEKQLEERLKGLKIDMGNIARVIADIAKKDKDKVIQDMLNRTKLYPEQAIEYGIVHEIKSELFPPGSEIISIQVTPKTPETGKSVSTPS
jgi:hypothetical protein